MKSLVTRPEFFVILLVFIRIFRYYFKYVKKGFLLLLHSLLDGI